MVENFDIFGTECFFLFNTPLKVSRQGISISIYFAPAVIDSEVVTKKFLSLADLSGAQTLCIYESTKVIVISKDKDFMFAIF